MRVKLSTVAAATAATFLLAACGPARRAAARPPPATAPGRAPATPAPSRARSPIGAVLSLTGAAASYGESQQQGLELAAEELDEKGGVTYDLTHRGRRDRPAPGHHALRGVRLRRRQPIIGPTLSNAALQADPIAQEAGVPVLGISNTAAGVTDIGDYIFRDSLTERRSSRRRSPRPPRHTA